MLLTNALWWAELLVLALVGLVAWLLTWLLLDGLVWLWRYRSHAARQRARMRDALAACQLAAPDWRPEVED